MAGTPDSLRNSTKCPGKPKRNWSKQPWFEEARDRAIAARIEWLVHQLERATTKVQVNKWSWFLERTRAYGGIFTDSATGSRTSVNVNASASAGGELSEPGSVMILKASDLEEARNALDKVKKRQAARLLNGHTPWADKQLPDSDQETGDLE